MRPARRARRGLTRVVHLFDLPASRSRRLSNPEARWPLSTIALDLRAQAVGRSAGRECCPICGCFGRRPITWHGRSFRLSDTSHALPTLVLLDDRRLSRGGRLSCLVASGPQRRTMDSRQTRLATKRPSAGGGSGDCGQIERTEHEVALLVLRGGAIPLSPRRRRDARPRRGDQQPGRGLARRAAIVLARRQRQGPTGEEAKGSVQPPDLEPFAVGVYNHPGSTNQPLPVCRQPIKICGAVRPAKRQMSGRSCVCDCAVRTSKFTLPAM
jgi:hypothetical protein